MSGHLARGVAALHHHREAPRRRLRLPVRGAAEARRVALALLAMAAWQLLSGLSNVVLGWPLLAALAHTAGAAVLVAALAVWLTRAALARETSSPVPALGTTARAML